MITINRLLFNKKQTNKHMSQNKYLDLAGLTAYDEKIKAWHQKHIQDVTDEKILNLFA